MTESDFEVIETALVDLANELYRAQNRPSMRTTDALASVPDLTRLFQSLKDHLREESTSLSDVSVPLSIVEAVDQGEDPATVISRWGLEDETSRRLKEASDARIDALVRNSKVE